MSYSAWPCRLRLLARGTWAAQAACLDLRGKGQAMSTDQILFGVGLNLVLAVGSQVLASRLRIPALIILLPAGFVAGALTTDVAG